MDGLGGGERRGGREGGRECEGGARGTFLKMQIASGEPGSFPGRTYEGLRYHLARSVDTPCPDDERNPEPPPHPAPVGRLIVCEFRIISGMNSGVGTCGREGGGGRRGTERSAGTERVGEAGWSWNGAKGSDMTGWGRRGGCGDGRVGGEGMERNKGE